jgi:Raf kinase inhibitor-like YbhB/YbcL family protein
MVNRHNGSPEVTRTTLSAACHRGDGPLAYHRLFVSTRAQVSFRLLALGVAATATLGACASSDGRNLPLPREDQFESIITTTTSTLPPDGVGGIVEPGTPAPTLSPVTVPLATAAATTVPVATAAPTTPPAVVAPFAIRLPWEPNGPIPVRNTCTGTAERDVAPAVQWSGVPAGTVELAVIFTDETAGGFVHWIVVGLDPASNGIPENLGLPGIAMELNSAGAPTYVGPCPPDAAPHTYTLEVLALSQQFETTGGAAADTVAALRSLTLSSAAQVGVFAAA